MVEISFFCFNLNLTYTCSYIQTVISMTPTCFAENRRQEIRYQYVQYSFGCFPSVNKLQPHMCGNLGFFQLFRIGILLLH